MSKSILVGNGFSSQLIDEYNNCKMIKAFKLKSPSVYNFLESKYAELRILRIKSSSKEDFKIRVTKKIGKNENIEWNRVELTIIDDFFNELFNIEKIYGIETIMKLAKLFRLPSLDKIEQDAIELCYNSGMNDLNSIKNINKNKYKEYFNTFEYVFTTNYDYILDDLYSKDVLHLHGGFDYYKIFYNRNGATGVNKFKARTDPVPMYLKDNAEIEKISKPFLIWGCNDIDKQSKMGGGFTFPITYPFFSPISLVKEYLSMLENKEIMELHIFGYSGLNDNHINSAIKKNKSIKKIIYYCNPKTEVKNNKFQAEISAKFKSNDCEVTFESWDVVWSKLA